MRTITARFLSFFVTLLFFGLAPFSSAQADDISQAQNPMLAYDGSGNLDFEFSNLPKY